MEQEYWLERKRASEAEAEVATTSKARLFHLELAERYSVMAVAVANQKRRQANAAARVVLQFSDEEIEIVRSWRMAARKIDTEPAAMDDAPPS